MKPQDINQTKSSATSETVRQRIQEANLYLDQGLFDEARSIYQSLLSHFQTQAQKVEASTPEAKGLAQTRVQVLQERIEEIDHRAAEFYGRPAATDRPQTVEIANDAEIIFNTGLALKELGLYAEAIVEFESAAELRHRVAECHEEIGRSLIQAGVLHQGIQELYHTLKLENITFSQRVGILKQIAFAYEEADDKKNALEVYRELVEIDKDHEYASRKIEVLTYELKRFRFNIATVCEHPRVFLIASLLFASIFLAFVPFIQTVDNVDYFTLEDHPDTEFYDRFKAVFGNDEFFVIAFSKENMFTEENLLLLNNITEELEEIEDLRDLTSLANVDDTVGEEDYFEVRKFLEDIPSDKGDLNKLRKQAVSNPLYARNLISPDAQTAAIVVATFERPEDGNYRKRLIAKCKKILKKFHQEGERFYLAGWTTTNLSLSQYMKKDIATFIPITYVLITLTMLLFFRNVRLTVLAVANISICMGSTMGLFALTGITLNNVTTIVPPLVMALALCDTVHIFSHMDKRVLVEFPDKPKALASVLKKVVMPCFLTTLTTAVAFLSLAVSEIPPIKEFAFLASSGMVFEFIYSFFFLPPLILFCSPEKVYKDYASHRGMTTFLRHLSDLIQKRYIPIAFAGCIVILAAGWFASQIRVETNIIEYFKRNSPVRTSLDFVEGRLSGVGTLDISLQAKAEDGFKEPSNLQVIEKIQNYIKSLRGVDVTISFVDFIKDMNESFHNEDPRFYRVPETMEMVSQYLLLYDSDEIEDFINGSYDHARISVRTSEHTSTKQARLVREIRDFIDGVEHPGLDIRVTGRALQEVNVNQAIVESQIYSLSLATGVIAIVMFLALRSVTIGFLSLIPNLFPVILNFGIMGAMDIPLNAATALIAAVALGIAVDDTIHFLSEYRLRRAQGMSIPDSLRIVTLVKGRAILSSSLILCIGFGVLVTSRFVLTINFGMLSAIIMITAVIGDLVVLPSIIMLKRSG